MTVVTTDSAAPVADLVIQCTGRVVNTLTFRAEGDPCGALFASAAPYSDADDWAERARVAGWRVPPIPALAAGDVPVTVEGFCPTCRGGS